MDFKQPVIEFEEISRERMKGAELSVLGRGPCGNKREDGWRQSFAGRKRRGREGRGGSERLSLNGEGKDPADSVDNWGGPQERSLGISVWAPMHSDNSTATDRQCGVHSGQGTEDHGGSLQAGRRGVLQRQGSWGVATNDRDQGCPGTPGNSEVDRDGLGMRLVASCQGSCSMDARLTIISACLSLLPPLGLALYSCVHLPSSSRASSKRYWSLSFSRVLFPVLF